MKLEWVLLIFGLFLAATRLPGVFRPERMRRWIWRVLQLRPRLLQLLGFLIFCIGFATLYSVLRRIDPVEFAGGVIGIGMMVYGLGWITPNLSRDLYRSSFMSTSPFVTRMASLFLSAMGVVLVWIAWKHL